MPRKPEQAIVGATLKVLRGKLTQSATSSKKVQVTQGDLAKALGVERTSIANIESGNQIVPQSIKAAYADFLKIPYDILSTFLDYMYGNDQSRDILQSHKFIKNLIPDSKGFQEAEEELTKKNTHQIHTYGTGFARKMIALSVTEMSQTLNGGELAIIGDIGPAIENSTFIVQYVSEGIVVIFGGKEIRIRGKDLTLQIAPTLQ